MEQNLKDLDSAKKQVEATVSASDKLQQVVSGYVKSLVSVQEGLKQWEKELQGVQVGNDTAFKNAIEQMGASCSEVVNLFKSKLDETKEGFENDTNSFLIKLESENGKLSEQVNALKVLGSSFDNAIQDVNSVKALLEGLSNDLKESQKSQDEVLDVIKEDVSKISNTTSNTVKGFVEEQTRKFETLHSGKDVKLQELANSISHGVAALLSVAGLVAMIINAVIFKKGAMTIVAASIFGSGFTALYFTSFLYHTTKNLKIKKTLQILDHCMIYVMICGSYAPVCLGMIKGVWGWAIWGVNVACMILGIVINLVDIHKFYRLSQALYILMGWMIVVGAVQMIRAIPLSGLLYLVAGGLLYTFGIIFYKMKDKKYMHLVFHLFVIAGSIPHFLFVLFYICR